MNRANGALRGLYHEIRASLITVVVTHTTGFLKWPRWLEAHFAMWWSSSTGSIIVSIRAADDDLTGSTRYVDDDNPPIRMTNTEKGAGGETLALMRGEKEI
ncbi:hypothetical protein HYFRA_00004896 [Hymenoscyphus fraxineus]|uniref:Uncharacterized protein n=1 Tax=Hymenoscyphus fraxineus TaxID=746836 RepID=A0A9N9KLN8_9HELO|nr:hypothetical protein HYFRA_00004896 [Hymenoscyphus fraxineus]